MVLQLIIPAIVLAAFLYIFLRRKEPGKHEPTDANTPESLQQVWNTREKPNDKLVLMKNVSYAAIQKVLTDFCQLYNQGKQQAAPRLTKISETTFAITFPDNIDAEIYCYFINYLKYPIDVQWTADVTGWTTTDNNAVWAYSAAMNKKVMLYLSAADTEYTSVYLTTEDNIGFRIGFSVGDCERFENPEKHYCLPEIAIDVITKMKFEDFQ